MDVLTSIKRRPVTPELEEIMKATMEDVQEGSCVGPFGSTEEVTKFLGSSAWIPTQRFAVNQANKVRGCDSATVNFVNVAAEIQEKLQLPSTDQNVAVIRRLWAEAEGCPIEGWVLDERKAYRQIPIKPDHRRFSVICFKNPQNHAMNYFVMIGHSFGLVAAVYNYNRRSALIDEILRKLFGLVSFCYYDDKYGFELQTTARSAAEVGRAAHTILGAQFDLKTLQNGQILEILGVTYDLWGMLLQIKDKRKRELVHEIESILKDDLLDPGHAGKLKGKLMFAGSQLWGKTGRAFLRAISERQYMKFKVYKDEKLKLNEALEAALKQWIRLILNGPTRELTIVNPKKSDVVIFTHGSYPDDRKRETKELNPPMIGAVMFSIFHLQPVQGSRVCRRSS